MFLVITAGNNCFGQLGRECQNECEKTTPNLIEFSEYSEKVIIVKICCGSLHNLLLSREGEIYVFGKNSEKELGIDTEADRQITPIQLFMSEIF